MKKFRISILLTLAMVFLVIFFGCAKTKQQTYAEAVKKTEAQTKGNYDLTINIANNFSSEALNNYKTLSNKTINNFIKNIDYLKKIQILNTRTYDNTKKIQQDDIKILSNNKEMKDTIYKNNDNIIIQSPMLNKLINFNINELEDVLSYMIFNEGVNVNLPKTKAKNLTTSAEKVTQKTEEVNQSLEVQRLQTIMEKFRNSWTAVEQEGTTKNTGNKTIKTPEGDKQVTEYTISFTPQQMQRIIQEYKKITDESIKTLYVEKINALTKLNKTQKQKTIEVLDKTINDFFNQLEIQQLSIKGYVAKDGYLVQKTGSYVLANKNAVAPFKEQKSDFSITYYNLGKDVSIKFPQVTNDNVIKLKNLKTTITQELNKVFTKK